MTRKELALLAVSTLATLLVALGLIRWLAPALLGGPRDLQLVQVDERVPPFYEGVFRPDHFRTVDFLLKDPRTVNRGRPFHGELPSVALGPHDVLGFRNRAVPAVADVVVIGDSQSYGVNAQLDDAWPGWMERQLGHAVVYSMALGSWGAVQYLDMFINAAAFRPRAIAVAFYSGNDALDSFSVAYGSALWRELRPDPELVATAPSPPFPPPESEWWSARFAAGTLTFAPRLRLVANQSHPAVDAGYGVMRKAAQVMSTLAERQGQQVVFTIVPTKELVYAPRVEAEKIAASADYIELVAQERRRIAELSAFLAGLPSASYVDLVGPLQEAALRRLDLYPQGVNGHPLAAGYSVIGRALAAAVAPHVPSRPEGWVLVEKPQESGGFSTYLIRDGIAWLFSDPRLIEANGWRQMSARYVSDRDLAGIPKREVLEADPARYGPRR